MKAVFLFLILQAFATIVVFCGSPRLIFLQSIFRHGDKYPPDSLQPRINEIMAEQRINFNQLTNQGKAQQFQLGKKMNEIYWQKLFRDKANDRDYHLRKIRVESTNISRTIESAQSHLLGLLSSLPPLIVDQEIQIPYISEDEEEEGQQLVHIPGYAFGKNGIIFHPHPIHIQIGTENLFQKYEKIAKPWESQNFNSQLALKVREYQPFAQAIREFQKSLNLSKGAISLQNYNRYYNDEESMKSLGYTTVLKSSNDIFATLNGIVWRLRFFSTEVQKRVIAGELIGSIVTNINNSLHNSDAPQWAINSNHQLGILMVLQALNITNAQCIFDNFAKRVTHSASCALVYPSFSSILVIEVYEQQKTHFFKVNYNGEHYKIPLCGGKKECELQKLFAWYESWKPIQNKQILQART